MVNAMEHTYRRVHSIGKIERVENHDWNAPTDEFDENELAAYERGEIWFTDIQARVEVYTQDVGAKWRKTHYFSSSVICGIPNDCDPADKETIWQDCMNDLIATLYAFAVPGWMIESAVSGDVELRGDVN